MINWVWNDGWVWDCEYVDGGFHNDGGCSPAEDWIGFIYGYQDTVLLLIIAKIVAGVFFGIAVFKINRLLAKLK